MGSHYQQQMTVCETLYADMVEQSVELDYMLPDYYPSIFKVLKGSLCPVINTWRIAANKLTIDGTCYLKVLYLNEEDGSLRLLEQKQAFVKTVELGVDATGAKACITAECSYFNCRAVSGRRLDLRGAVAMQVQVTRQRQQELLGEDDRLQLQQCELTCCTNQLMVWKEQSLSEQLSIGQGNQPIGEVIGYHGVAVLSDCQVHSGKVICKGEVRLHTLYLPVDEGGKPEKLEQIVPISQIIEVMGLEEEDTVSTYCEVLRYDLELQMDGDGTCRSFTAELGVRYCCQVAKNNAVQLVTDGYSTRYETNLDLQTLPIRQLLTPIQSELVCKETVNLQVEISAVHTLLADLQGISYQSREDGMWLCGNLLLTVLADDREGQTLCLEQTLPLEALLLQRPDEGERVCQANTQVLGVDFQILSADRLEIRTTLLTSGMLYACQNRAVIVQATVQEDCPKQRQDRVAMRLYFAEEGETVWQIAKRYNTTVDAIVQENELQTEAMGNRKMLLIPQVD